MAQWNPEIMRVQKQAIDEALEKMQQLNDELTGNVAVFAATVQDQVVDHTKAMIQEINVLLQDIRERVAKQVDKMEQAARGLSALESAAADRIKSIR